MDQFSYENLDWDPDYLANIFDQDFYKMAEMWCGDDSPSDSDLVCSVDSTEREIYSPICEDISMEDEVLREAVEVIENQ